MTYLGLLGNSPFPVLSNDIAMRQAVAHKEEIRFMSQDNGTIVCSYLVSMEGTFDCMYSREARGIVFDQNGNVISRPLHKFFNVNEKPTTLIAALDWTQVVRVMDKRDGSMIHTVNVGSEKSPFATSKWNASFDVKSKKSYASDVANAAREFIKNDSNYQAFCQTMTDQGKTAVFEWTSPYARIVLAYGQNELKLLHVRDNVSGEYMTREELQKVASVCNIPLVDHFNDISFNNGMLEIKIDYEPEPGVKFVKSAFIDFNQSNKQIQDNLLALVEEAQNVEGWVFQFKNGDMVKLKTKWYMERHRAMTFLRERDIALMVLRESLDDLKALLVSEGANIAEILAIEERTVVMLNDLQKSVEGAYEAYKTLDRKTFAMRFQSGEHAHPHFPLLMQKFSGKEPDYKGYFERKFLPDVPLRQLNLVQSVAEAE
jgi:RNA ligase